MKRMTVAAGIAAGIAMTLAAAPAPGEYEGHNLAYYVKRADYHPLLQNPLNYHPNSGVSERMAAIEALGNFGSNAVPKLTDIIREPNRADVEKWTAIEALGVIGCDACGAGPLLITYATNALWQGKANSATSTGKAVDALGKIQATSAVPVLVTMLTEIESCGTKLDAQTRASHLVRVIWALQALATAADAKAIAPTLQKIVADATATNAPTESKHLPENARNLLRKLQGPSK